MNIKYVQRLPVAKCKSVFEISSIDVLPQYQQVKQFIRQHRLTDVLFTEGQQFTEPTKSYECIVITISNNWFISLQQLIQVLKNLVKYTTKYFYVVINKFLIYTEHDNQEQTHLSDLDQRLVQHIVDKLDLCLVDANWNANDQGQLGNFQYPITQLIFDVTK